MGTKIVEHAINPLASVAGESDLRFSIQFCVNDRKYQPAKKLIDKRSTVSMDRFLNKQNAESIKKTMQAQEEIFKQQVLELHRVYSVQKMLMDELKKERQQRRHRTNHPNYLTSHATTFAYNNNNNNNISRDIKGNNPSSRERSGSCSGDTINTRPRQGIVDLQDIDLERPADLHVEDSELELTLSIGLSSSSSRSYQREINRDIDSSTASFRSDNQNNNQDCSGPSTPLSSSSTTLDQEKKRPHWLLQGLSINRTS